MVTSIAFCGMGVFSSKEIRCGESLTYEGVLGTKGLIMWSMNAETRSVGGFVEFFEKVHTLCSDFLCRIEKGMGMLIYVADSFMLSTSSPILLHIEAVGSDANGLYMDVSARWVLPSAI